MDCYQLQLIILLIATGAPTCFTKTTLLIVISDLNQVRPIFLEHP